MGNKKPFAILAGIAAFLVASFGTRQLIDHFRRDPAIASNILERSWVEQGLADTSVAFQVPWQLQPQELKMPAEVQRLMSSSATLSHEADGLNVMAMHIAFVPGTPTSLDGAAKGAIDNMRTVPGTVSVDGHRKDVTLFGSMRAIEIDAHVARQRGVPLQVRGIVFGSGPELYQVLMICRADQSVGSAVWDRIRSSIHVKG